MFNDVGFFLVIRAIFLLKLIKIYSTNAFNRLFQYNAAAPKWQLMKVTVFPTVHNTSGKFSDNFDSFLSELTAFMLPHTFSDPKE